MRILAIFDIHGHPEPIQALVAKEAARFDSVVVAGDIGGYCHTAAEILAPLKAFRCPVAYIYGNWDNELDYGADLGIGHHLHGYPLVDGYAFVGFSGCDAHWGKNPTRHVIRQEEDAEAPRPEDGTPKPSAARRSPARENAEAMTQLWEATGVPAGRTTVVTHDPTYRLHDLIPGLALHVFGHRHGFEDREQRGTRVVNVSAADDGEWQYGSNTRTGQQVRRPKPGTCLVGNYAVIEMSEGRIMACPVPLYP